MLQRLSVMLFFIPLCITVTFAAEDTSAFRFNTSSVPVGTVFHYVKSNHDGSNPENIAIFMADQERVEVFKYHEPNTRAALVKAWMDWSIFSARKLESFQMTGADQQELVAVMNFDGASNSAEFRLLIENEPPRSIRVDRVPFHVYNFDFTSLNMAMHHLAEPKSKFEIGVADLLFTEDSWKPVYRGSVTIAYETDEEINGSLCRRYGINGPGLENKGGFLWVNSANGNVERMKIELPDNPNWTNFLLDLKKTESMSAGRWNQFLQEHFAN